MKPMGQPTKYPKNPQAGVGNAMPILPQGDDPPPKAKAYYKYKFAALYGISTRTLAKWMARYKDDLESLGYQKTDKILRPEVVQYLFDRLGWP